MSTDVGPGAAETRWQNLRNLQRRPGPDLLSAILDNFCAEDGRHSDAVGVMARPQLERDF
jgi:hypothetical protein